MIDMATGRAMFAAGCFWGVESAFRAVEGVTDVAVGYSGGSLENPTYGDVCGGGTGHAEAVLVDFDPGRVSYKDLLQVFWNIHDPTTLNRQGPDLGSQYRSGIYFFTPGQESEARQSLAEQDASGRFRHPIVTEIKPAGTFWRAEEYHQRYNEKHGRVSCG
ncbi:MAG: peptide-methionine (S)-S-oxide reductase MsrA [Thermoleophilia bacterium]